MSLCHFLPLPLTMHERNPPTLQGTAYRRIQFSTCGNFALPDKLSIHQHHRGVPPAMAQRLPEASEPGFNLQFDEPIRVCGHHPPRLSYRQVAFHTFAVDAKKPFLSCPAVNSDFYRISHGAIPHRVRTPGGLLSATLTSSRRVSLPPTYRLFGFRPCPLQWRRCELSR